jgi:hypothetical protein
VTMCWKKRCSASSTWATTSGGYRVIIRHVRQGTVWRSIYQGAERRADVRMVASGAGQSVPGRTTRSCLHVDSPFQRSSSQSHLRSIRHRDRQAFFGGCDSAVIVEFANTQVLRNDAGYNFFLKVSIVPPMHSGVLTVETNTASHILPM